jgi:hypothetical protein
MPNPSPFFHQKNVQGTGHHRAKNACPIIERDWGEPLN